MKSAHFRKRIFRFGMRTLFGFVTACALLLAWYTANARQVERETRSLADLDNLADGWYIATLYDEENTIYCGTGLGGVAHLRWNGPAWLRRPLMACGMPVLYRVDRLSLYETFTDDAIPHIGEFSSLEELTLLGTDITPDGLRRLRAMFPQAEIEYKRSQNPIPVPG